MRTVLHSFFKKFLPLYHYFLAWSGAVFYRHPSRKLFVVGVTGTKGKSSTAELVNALLESAGYKTALSGTIRFKIGDESRPNSYKMSMPGRFFLQKFLHDAVKAHCTHVVIEMTSEGAKQFRHKWIALDALIFTNLSPEHIESHGSYDNYVVAKLSIAHELARSPKKDRSMVANTDDAEAEKFLSVNVPHKVRFSLEDIEHYTIKPNGIDFTYQGTNFHSPLTGLFNLYNILGALSLARVIGIDTQTMWDAINSLGAIRGRVERIDAGQNFNVVVDYAHTPDSLEKFYQAFPDRRKICILGNTGGGRDKWKRPEMGRIADTYCDEIILTNEDPYDEKPENIINDMLPGFSKHEPKIIIDRREAIKTALAHARADCVVLITGKGTDPYIMGPNGTKEKWDDATVVREELEKMK